MKPTAILAILLITILASCSSDDDNDPKYNWELKIHHKTYDKDGNPSNIFGMESEFDEKITIENKSEKQINDYLAKEYKNKLCPLCYPDQKPWPYPEEYPIWKDPNSDFYYYKEEIPGTQAGILPSGPIYHERTGTLKKLN